MTSPTCHLRSTRAAAAVLLLCALGLSSTGAQVLPPGFELLSLPGELNRPTDMAVANDGTLYIATKAGEVHRHDGLELQLAPCIDLRDEINDFGDRGLLGLALHPGFSPDGGARSWVYLLYTVSPLPGQDVVYNFDDMFSFGRLTRYRAGSVAGEVLLEESSRQVLLGNQLPDGSVPDAIASVHLSHASGTLAFASDGSLYVTTGDGSHFDLVDAGGNDDAAFDDWVHPDTLQKGPTPKAQDSGAFRAQSLESLAGKLLRINPSTGAGYASNPFFDGDVFSNPSRVWALGLRNPFRAALLPGSGETDPSAGDPNPLIIGDVGWGDREELNLCLGGENFGWPCLEGFAPSFGYPGFDPPAPGFPNCNTAMPGLATLPFAAWGHSDPADLLPPDSHVDEQGVPQQGIFGSTVIGGVWYARGDYPQQYHERLFFGDFGWSWLRTLSFDEPQGPLWMRDFGEGVLFPVDLERDPLSGDILVLHLFTATGNGGISRLTFAEPWQDLGQGLAGSGPAPNLTGTGSLAPGSPFVLEAAGLLPDSALTFFVGFSELGAPFKGGVLVPDPAAPGFDLSLPSGDGSLSLPGSWPLEIPPGLPFWVQAWQADPEGPQGAAASNALLGTSH
ncbi:MAG: hypothetical protein DRQ55_06400 [Planctomycetota bacterium]|nr:MAG: hypothetical protein DRQ55_06400 [Planctomycetota bacterium]